MRPAHPLLGIGILTLASAAFGTSGPFAKALIEAGWTPGAVVLIRMVGATAVLLPWGLWLIRDRLHLVRAELPRVAAYGALAVASAQFGYFQAVELLPVGIALLLEYLGIILVVLWVWLVRGQRPNAVTAAGVAVALAGLALVLNLTSAGGPNLVGVAWGLLAAVGLAGHYLIAGRETALPALTFAGLGLGFGAVYLAVLGAARLIEMHTGGATVTLAGRGLPAGWALAELVLVAAAFAYAAGIVGARMLGSTVASVLGLSEVLFAVLFAWLILGEAPTALQFVGGAVVLTGIAMVQLAQRRRPVPADLEATAPLA